MHVHVVEECSFESYVISPPKCTCTYSPIRYVIDQTTGLVDTSIAAEWIGSGGKVPRYFNIDPRNQFLVMANQEGAPFDNLSVFRILHQENGKLEFVRSIHSGTPSWIEFMTLPVSTSLQSKL